jgi:hypothetical protein
MPETLRVVKGYSPYDLPGSESVFNLALSQDTGLCVEVRPRKRSQAGARKIKVNFGKPEQFELALI